MTDSSSSTALTITPEQLKIILTQAVQAATIAGNSSSSSSSPSDKLPKGVKVQIPTFSAGNDCQKYKQLCSRWESRVAEHFKPETRVEMLLDEVEEDERLEIWNHLQEHVDASTTYKRKGKVQISDPNDSTKLIDHAHASLAVTWWCDFLETRYGDGIQQRSEQVFKNLETLQPQNNETIQAFCNRWGLAATEVMNHSLSEVLLHRLLTMIDLDKAGKLLVKQSWEALSSRTNMTDKEKLKWHMSYVQDTFGSTQITAIPSNSEKEKTVDPTATPSQLAVWQEQGDDSRFWTRIAGVKTECLPCPEKNNAYTAQFTFKKGKGKGRGAKGKGKGKGKGSFPPCAHCGKTNHTADRCWWKNGNANKGTGNLSMTVDQWVDGT